MNAPLPADALRAAPGNPLLAPWTAPFRLPPYAQIDAAHIAPALQAAMAEHRAEWTAIAQDSAPPSFDNSFGALDRAGARLSAVASVFDSLSASATSDAIQAVERDMAGPMAAHHAAMHLDAALFARLEAAWALADAQGWSAEERRLAERIRLRFVRAGAQLADEHRARYAAIVSELAELTTAFGQNVLHDESHFALPLVDPEDLAGLLAFVVDAAREAARQRQHDAPYVITLSRSLIVPFLTFSTRRDLREAAWRAWVSRGEHPGAHDNRPIAKRILALRQEQAQLLGYPNFAAYATADSMAGSPAAVRALLERVWTPAVEAVGRERAQLEAVQAEDGHAGEPIEAWDWRYWAEKVRSRRYAVDDGAVKPYFPLERVVEAAFDCAERLFGLRFTPREDLPTYHPDVRAFEVHDREGRPVGIFLQDNFARPTKRSGAWMSTLRMQHRNGGADSAEGAQWPVVLNNNNFAKGAPGTPTLLSLDDVRTLFHEFGHGLHGLLSNVRFVTLAGPEVLRDFVELPSQIFEHWAEAPEILARHARHHQSGEPIPQPLVAALKKAQHFNQGYETVRYLASALVDLALHERNPPPDDVVAFESAELERIGLPHGVGLNHRLPHFGHLFSGDYYAAGYYVYLWAEVLDADGYAAFEEAGDPFAPEWAARLKEHIYASGNSRPPAEAYRAFRGRDPEVVHLLRQRGLVA